MADERSDLIVLDGPDRSREMVPNVVLFFHGFEEAEGEDFLLRSIADGLKAPNNRMQAVDALCAIVAEKVIALKTIGTREALDMLLPTARLIQRNLKGEQALGLKPFDMALYELYRELVEAGGSVERMKIGMALGDRATHFTGGWTGSRTLSRSMKPEEQIRYGKQMAARGYGAAESAALAKPNHPKSKIVAQTVPGIRRNFGNIVRVLRSFHADEVDDVRGAIN